MVGMDTKPSLLLLLLAQPVAAQGLVGLTGDTLEVVSVDPGTADLTSLGTVSGLSPIADLGSLAVGPGGVLYACTTGGGPELYTIDPATWEATLVGSTGVSFLFEGGIAIAPNGDAWVANGGSAGAPRLLTLDLATGATTVVGTLPGGQHDLNGLEYRASDSMLIGLDRVTNALVEVDPNTADLTVLATVPGSVGIVGGLAVLGGQGYLATAATSGLGSNELYSFDLDTGAMTLVGTLDGSGPNGLAGLSAWTGTSVGTSYCTALANSTGAPALLTAVGSAIAADNALGLLAEPVPNQPGLFFYGDAQNLAPFGNGFLCAGGFLVRLGSPATASGNVAQVLVDLVGEGLVAGDTRHFQYWYRDPVAGGAGFNLSDAVTINFQ